MNSVDYDKNRFTVDAYGNLFPKQDKKNQQKCKHCGRIVGCDYHGRKHKCGCNRRDGE